MKEDTKEKMLTNEFVIGMTFWMCSWWLMSEYRPYSSALFNTIGLVFFAKDIINKFRNRRKK